jgi:serine/threonine-protein kinase HipA
VSEALGVCVHNQPVGQLIREQGDYLFRYSSTATPDDFISLTMPVRRKDYLLPNLHPVFEMHLPEGYLLALFKKHFAKLRPTDDFGLLQLLAPSIRGRLHFQTAAEPNPGPLQLDDLLHPQQGLFEELIERFALRSALSGVQPKVLAQLENRATLKLDEYIVKAWGTEYPELALNEYCCMLAARDAGLSVPEFYLSDDNSLFIMKRFDLNDQGKALGFEDMCVLQARQRDDKYSGSYEQLAKSIKVFCSAQYKQSSLQQYFKLMVLNYRLQNGDAHLKNFGLLYEDIASIRLAPAYDILSTTAYVKRDVPALNMHGSKRWWDKKGLLRFGMEACDLSRQQAVDILDQCDEAFKTTHHYISQRLTMASNIQQQQILEHLARLTGPADSNKPI